MVLQVGSYIAGLEASTALSCSLIATSWPLSPADHNLDRDPVFGKACVCPLDSGGRIRSRNHKCCMALSSCSCITSYILIPLATFGMIHYHGILLCLGCGTNLRKNVRSPDFTPQTLVSVAVRDVMAWRSA